MKVLIGGVIKKGVTYASTLVWSCQVMPSSVMTLIRCQDWTLAFISFPNGELNQTLVYKPLHLLYLVRETDGRLRPPSTQLCTRSTLVFLEKPTERSVRVLLTHPSDPEPLVSSVFPCYSRRKVSGVGGQGLAL